MYGMTVESIKVNTKMTRNMVTVFIHGLMVAVMRAIGLEESNMDLERTLFPRMKKLNTVFGRTEKE